MSKQLHLSQCDSYDKMFVFDVNCKTKDRCSYIVRVGSKRMDCNNVKTFAECLNFPDMTSTNSTESKMPIMWHITPSEIAIGMQDIFKNKCSGGNDPKCSPFSNIMITNDPKSDDMCASGKSPNTYWRVKTDIHEDNISAKKLLCELACPTLHMQELAGMPNKCSKEYYDLCRSTGCEVDYFCKIRMNFKESDYVPDHTYLERDDNLMSMVNRK